MAGRPTERWRKRASARPQLGVREPISRTTRGCVPENAARSLFASIHLVADSSLEILVVSHYSLLGLWNGGFWINSSGLLKGSMR
jgi:hypothetical protein